MLLLSSIRKLFKLVWSSTLRTLSILDPKPQGTLQVKTLKPKTLKLTTLKPKRP